MSEKREVMLLLENAFNEGRKQGLKEAQKYAVELQGCGMDDLFDDLVSTDVNDYFCGLLDEKES